MILAQKTQPGAKCILFQLKFTLFQHKYSFDSMFISEIQKFALFHAAIYYANWLHNELINVMEKADVIGQNAIDELPTK